MLCLQKSLLERLWFLGNESQIFLLLISEGACPISQFCESQFSQPQRRPYVLSSPSPSSLALSFSLFLLTEIRCLIPVTLLLRGLNFLPLSVCGGDKLGLGVRPDLNLIKSPLFLIQPILLTVEGYSCLCVRSCGCCFVAHINDSELIHLSVLCSVKQV